MHDILFIHRSIWLPPTRHSVSASVRGRNGPPAADGGFTRPRSRCGERGPIRKGREPGKHRRGRSEPASCGSGKSPQGRYGNAKGASGEVSSATRPTGSSPGAALVEAGAGKAALERSWAAGPGPGDSRGDPGERPEPLELTSLPYPGMATELETVGVGGDTSPHY